MSILQESQLETSVYSCNFQCFIRQANITMKFPCSYFVEWRTLNSKIIVQTNKHSPQDAFTIFDEKLTINVQMLYDHVKLEFVKRQTIIELYLISRSRPDQNKLVGRVTIDLAKVINVGMYEEPTEFKLNFSSVGGVLVMQFKALDRRLTTLALQDLDKSSFLDFVAQTALKGPARAQSMIQSHYQGPNGSQKANREARAVSPINNMSKSAIKKSILFNKESLVRGSFDVAQDQRQEVIIHNYTNIPLNNTMKEKNIASQKQQLLTQPAKQKQLGNQSVTKQIIFSDSVENLEPLQPTFNHTNQQQNFIKTSSAPIFQKNTSQNQQASNEIRRTANNNIQVKDNEESKSLLMHQREQLSVYTKQNEELRVQLERWRGKSNESQSSKNRLQQLNVELNDKILHEKNVNKQLLEEISKKNKIIGQFDHELTQKQSMIVILEGKVSSFTEKQKSLFNNSEELKKQNATILQKNQQLMKNLELHQKNVAFYQQKCEKYEEKIKKSTQIQRQFNNTIKDLRQTEQHLKKKNQQLQIQNNGLVNSLQEYRKIMQQKIHGQGNNDDERHNLQDEVNHYKAKLEETVDKFQQLSKQLSFVTEKYMELQNLYDDQVKISENLQSQLTDLETHQQNTVEENISQVIEVVQKEQQTLSLLKIENDLLKKQIQTIKSKKLDQQRKAKEQIQVFLLEINNLKTQMNLLQKNMKQSQEMNDNLQKYNQSIENQLAQKQQIMKQNNFLKQQIDNLSLQIDQLNRQIQQMGENQLQNHRISGLQQLQQQNKQLRQQYKGVEGQIQFYQKQLLILKDEIISIRQARSSKENISSKQNDKQLQITQEKIKQYEDVIAKLNNNYEQQIYQNNELSETIMRYMDKEAKMKQTLQILEKQSKEIFTLVQQKQQNEESYRRAIEELQQQIVKLKSKEAEQQKSPTKSQNSVPPKYQYSPNVSNNDLIRLQGEKEELQVVNSQLRQLNEKLNSELMSLNFQFNQKKSILQSQISQLTEKNSFLQNSLQKQEDLHSNKIKQCDKNYRAKDMQVQIWKSRAKNYEQQKTSIQNEFNRLKTTLQEVQEEKFILQSSINEKQIKIMEMQEEINLLLSQITQFQQLNPINYQQKPIVSSSSDLFVQLKEKLFSKTLQNDWQSLIQSVLQRSMTAEQTSKLINLQQKSRLLSKQLQKIKSQLLKSEWRNNQQKITLMSLFKKCDSTVSELISAAQSLNQNQSSFL